MYGLHRPNAGRVVRLGALALLVVVVCSATAAMAATGHETKAPGKPTSVVGLSAHVSLPDVAPAGGSPPSPGTTNDAVPGGALDRPLGAGQVVVLEALTASTTFTFPSTTCASNSDYEWLLPGLWIFDTSGNLVDYIFAEVNCNAGLKNQDFGACIQGTCKVSKVTPSPGDVMEAVYSQDSTGAAGFIDDRTQRATVEQGGSPLSGASAEFEGDLGPAAFGVSAVPTFTDIPFSISTLNGAYIHDWFPIRLNLQTGPRVQIKASPATTTSFTTTWFHN